MKKILDFIKKNKAVIIYILLVCVFPIIVIHFLFKLSSHVEWIKAEWSAGEILAYFGSLIGGILTIIGVYLTVQASNKQYRDEQRNSVKPYLSFCDNSYTKPRDLSSEQCITCTLRNNNIPMFDFKDFDLSTIANNDVRKTIYSEGAILYTIDNKLRVFEFRLKNIGKGVAKSLYIESNGMSSFKTDVLIGGELKFLIYLKDYLPKELKYKIVYENLFDDVFEIEMYILWEWGSYFIKIERKE